MSEVSPLHADEESVIERLAALVHGAWADERRKQGWSYGEKRDDASRSSPALIPYHELAEAERELDRATVRRTLAGLGELGYRLELDPLRDTGSSREQILLESDRLIARGRPLPAYDLTKRWLAEHPGDADVQLANARALRRCGALRLALAALDKLGETPDPTGERRGVRAAVYKELFVRSLRDPASGAVDHLVRAQSLYQDAFDESNDARYWHGINAATLAFLLGQDELARSLAERVAASCATSEAPADAYWLVATRAEAALVLGRFDVAAAEYREAVKAGGDRIGDIASTRRNALLLLDAHRPAPAERRAIESALEPPAVVVFAGHPLDRADALRSRLPEEIVDELRRAIDDRLGVFNSGFGFSGAAPGAEMLFAEAMLERDPGVMNVVLPWPREQFAATHVRAAGAAWQRRFEALLGTGAQPPRVQHVVNATLGVGIDVPIYERFAQQLVFGLARLHAGMLLTKVVPLVVWDGERSTHTEDVGALVDQWHSLGVQLEPVNVIDVKGLARRPGRRAAPPSGGGVAQPSANHDSPFRVMAILFADVENYSKIPEDRLPIFIEYFVGGIGSRLGLKPHRPVNVRRVGDGILMVFSSVRDAALCALDLVDWVANHSLPAADGETYWSRVGLPREMRIRVALHAGPIFECVDPLTRAPAFEGAHINYAARIEPVTPGNQVYASEAFAALAVSWPEPCDEVVCEYVGRTTLAKKFGEYPLYHVRRRE